LKIIANIAKYFLPGGYHICGITADTCCYYASRRVLSRAENGMNMISNEELDDEVRWANFHVASPHDAFTSVYLYRVDRYIHDGPTRRRFIR